MSTIEKDARHFFEVNDDCVIDSSLLLTYKEELDEVFELYYTLINPLIFQYEVLANEFPIEILNEIRAIFTHLCRCTQEKSDKGVITHNLEKAKSHAKRAVLDGYKYNCVVFDDYYQSFMERYKWIDLSLIDNGEFLPSVDRCYQNAESYMIEAKTLEMENVSQDILYESYEKAYHTYYFVYQMIKNVEIHAEQLNHKKTEDNKKEQRKRKLELCITIISVVVTIISILFG